MEDCSGKNVQINLTTSPGEGSEAKLLKTTRKNVGVGLGIRLPCMTTALLSQVNNACLLGAKSNL
jgi:hypothetical protein